MNLQFLEIHPFIKIAIIPKLNIYVIAIKFIT